LTKLRNGKGGKNECRRMQKTASRNNLVDKLEEEIGLSSTFSKPYLIQNKAKKCGLFVIFYSMLCSLFFFKDSHKMPG
jgi:hypothetical protein